MVVTVNTDASYQIQHKIGGYAYWIVYEGQRIKKGGVLKECSSALEAELKAIANALHKVLTLKIIDTYLIIVNTDCIYAIESIAGTRKIKRPEVEKTVQAIKDYTQMLKGQSKIIKSDRDFIEFRYVKAHSTNKDKRSYVNNWCDKTAKGYVKNHIQHINKL